MHVVLFDKVVNPDTFNDDIHVVIFDKVVNPDTFNDDDNVVKSCYSHYSSMIIN